MAKKQSVNDMLKGAGASISGAVKTATSSAKAPAKNTAKPPKPQPQLRQGSPSKTVKGAPGKPDVKVPAGGLGGRNASIGPPKPHPGKLIEQYAESAIPLGAVPKMMGGAARGLAQGVARAKPLSYITAKIHKPTPPVKPPAPKSSNPFKGAIKPEPPKKPAKPSNKTSNNSGYSEPNKKALVSTLKKENTRKPSKEREFSPSDTPKKIVKSIGEGAKSRMSPTGKPTTLRNYPDYELPYKDSRRNTPQDPTNARHKREYKQHDAPFTAGRIQSRSTKLDTTLGGIRRTEVSTVDPKFNSAKDKTTKFLTPTNKSKPPVGKMWEVKQKPKSPKPSGITKPVKNAVKNLPKDKPKIKDKDYTTKEYQKSAPKSRGEKERIKKYHEELKYESPNDDMETWERNLHKTEEWPSAIRERKAKALKAVKKDKAAQTQHVVGNRLYKNKRTSK